MEINLNFEKGNGLLPAVAQDWQTGQVLMLAFMNREAWEKTLATRRVHYWSRSRNELWLKGGTSGHVQMVKEVFIDCDGDTILLKVEQLGGAACHTGHKSCFFQKIKNDGTIEICSEKVFDPEEVYKK
ncbi:MAG: phosphoribosyl-AMP cyclohydrolase [Deltaproteobacteria bacterium]|nr:phosphoribosyl-AMP cyclohydrolase [Deltaproteobacteria bacterium]